MSDVLVFLNKNSGALTVLFTAIVTLSTVAYVLLTATLVSETRRLREVQTEPKINIAFRPREEWINFIDLEIKNIGQGPAYNIQFNVTAETDSEANKNLVADLLKINMIRHGLRYLSPERGFCSFFTSMADGFNDKKVARFNVVITYESALKKRYKETFVLDFSELVGLLQLGEPPIHKIANKLEAMERDLHNIASGWKRFGVDVYSAKDRAEERAETKARLEKLSSNQQVSASENGESAEQGTAPDSNAAYVPPA